MGTKIQETNSKNIGTKVKKIWELNSGIKIREQKSKN
jgi:hypothetical protein